VQCWVVEPDCDTRAGRPPENVRLSAGIDDAEPPDGDDPLEQMRQKHGAYEAGWVDCRSPSAGHCFSLLAGGGLDDDRFGLGLIFVAQT